MKRYIILLLFFILVFSCKKDKLKDYVGDYKFTVIEHNWMGGDSTSACYCIDTFIYNGQIKYFETDDIQYDESSDNIGNENGISIVFLKNILITTDIENNGKFIEESGYHYKHTGEFLPNNKVSFSVTGLGGLGAGWDYYVTGVKN